MNREGKKCVLYPRVSTEMQVDGYSLEGQKNGLSRFMQRITFWKMDNMKELSARNCGKRFTQSVWQQELNSHPKSVRIGHTF